MRGIHIEQSAATAIVPHARIFSVCNEPQPGERGAQARESTNRHIRCTPAASVSSLQPITAVNYVPEKNREQRDREHTDADAGQEAQPTKAPKRTHESGYGGRGGEPRTSSNEREPAEPTGQEPA